MKKLRVYDKTGDFIIEIPDDAEATFGYFNPASSSESRNKYGGFDGAGSQTMKTTALRIYEMRGRKKHQIACFLGVNGFRDETVKLTKLNEKVIIETNYENDGDGTIEFGSKSQRQITAVPEPGAYR